MIKQFYFTHRWDPNRYYHSWSEWNHELWKWRVLLILQSLWTGNSPSDHLVSYPEHSLEMESYPSVVMLSAYSITTTNWTVIIGKWNDKKNYQIWNHFWTHSFQYIYIYIYIYIRFYISYAMEVSLRPYVSTSWSLSSQTNFHAIKYIKVNIYLFIIIII